MAVRIRLRQYEGPLHLLVDLIESQELDIWDIPIAQITDQYLAYLAEMHEQSLDIGGEFLVMAATLLVLKARMLLPPTEERQTEDDEGPDPRQLLTQRLAEYQRFRRAAAGLDALLRERGVVTGRGVPPPPGRTYYTRPAGNATVADLARAYAHVLEALREEPPSWAPPEPTISVEERSLQLVNRLQKEVRLQFPELFRGERDRRVVVVTFLALLELVRQGFAVAVQSAPREPIWVERSEERESDETPSTGTP